MSLKSYLKDWANNKHWETKYDKKEALRIATKLAKHFKVKIEIHFNKINTGYAYYSWTGRIDLPRKDISLGMICHEIGHILAYTKGYKGHNKKGYKYIKRVYKYAIRYIPYKILMGIKEQLYLEYKGGK